MAHAPMFDRRTFLTAAAALACSRPSTHANAEDAGESSVPLGIPDISNSEKIMYCAVRLVGRHNGGSSAGTGFFYQLFEGPKLVFTAIVTNRHVVDSMETCSFTVHKTRLNRPTNDNVITVDISRFREKVFSHPIEDLAIINVNEELNSLRATGSAPFIVTTHASDVPSQDILEAISPIEEVLTVGYPGMFFDSSHNIPLFHAGHTATPLYLPFTTQIVGEDNTTIYHNSKAFIVDFTTWSGASRSPVFIYNTNGYIDRAGKAHVFLQRLLLVGIVQGLATQSVSGQFEITLFPNKIHGSEAVPIPTNLGICLSSSSLLEFEDLLLASGYKPAWEYTKATK